MPEDSQFRDREKKLAELCGLRSIEWPSARRARFGRLEAFFADLGRLGDAGDLFLTPPGLAHPEPRVVAMAARATGDLLLCWPIDRWAELDARLRKAWAAVPWFLGTAIEPRGEPAWVDRLPESGTERIAGLVLLSCHGNGFVRQRALESMPAAATVASLGATALRLSDWVDEVREHALGMWGTLLGGASVETAIEVLPLVHRMLSRSRTDPERVREPLHDLLSSPAGHCELLRRLRGSRSRRAKVVLAEILALDPVPEGWVPLALAHAEPSIRLRGFRALAEQGPDGALAPHLDSMARDAFGPIRNLALELCETRFPGRLEAMARRLLLDASPGLRRRCQEHLVLRVDVDPAELAREALEGPKYPRRKAAALLVLSESGSNQDRGRFEAHLHAESPRVRAAALSGLGRLMEPAELDALFRWLDDPSPRVIRAAEAVLAGGRWALPRFLTVYRGLGSAVGRRAMVRLASRLPFWGRALFLTEAAEDAGEDVSRSASNAILRLGSKQPGWPPPPSPEQHRELEARIRIRKLEPAAVEKLRELLWSVAAR